MKRILLILLLFISVKAFAQYPAPAGVSNFLSSQFFYKISGGDTTVYAKSSNGLWFPMGRASDIIFSTNFQGLGTLASPLDHADTIRKTNWVFKGGLILDDSLLAQNKLLWLKGSVTSNPYLARSMALETRLHAGSNFALLLNMDLNAAFYDHGFTNVYHAQLKSSGDMIPGLDTLYNLGHIDTAAGRHYQWKNVYTKRLISDYDLHLQSNTSKIYLDGLPDTTVGYKAVVITADGRVQTAPYGGGGGNTIYTTDDSLRSDRIVTQNLHPLLFYSNNPTSNLSGVLDLEYNYQNMSVTDSLGNAAQVGTTTRLSNDQSQAFIAVQKGAKLKLIQMNSNPNGHSVDFKGIYFTDDIDSVGAIYTDTTSYKYGKRYNTWIPSWGAVKTRIDSAVAAHTGGITALTGDVTASGTGSVPATLATVNSNVGSFGDATHVGVFTVNGKGLITVASSTAITFPVTASNSVAFTNKTGNISQWTNDSNYITLGSLSATSPIFYNNTTGVISSQAASASQNGYLTSTDWSTFNGKISSTNFVDSETPTGSINSSNTSFTLANTPIAGSLKVYENGLRLKNIIDYTQSGTALTMVIAPTTGDTLLLDYRK